MLFLQIKYIIKASVGALLLFILSGCVSHKSNSYVPVHNSSYQDIYTYKSKQISKKSHLIKPYKKKKKPKKIVRPKKIILQKEKVKLFNQELEAYALQKTTVKVYPFPSNKLRGMMGKSWYKLSSRGNPVNRLIDSNTFCFNKTSSRRFQTPYYKVIFDEPMKIKNIFIHHDEEAYNDKDVKIALKPSLYKLKVKNNTDKYYIYSKAESYSKYKITNYIKQNSTLVDGLNYSSSEFLPEIYIAFDDLQDLYSTSFINIKKAPTIEVEGYSIKSVVFNTLKTRNSKIYNEALVRQIFIKDKKLYRMIQKNVRKFILPRHSIARLPIVGKKKIERKKEKRKKKVKTKKKVKSIFFDDSDVIYHPSTGIKVSTHVKKLKTGYTKQNDDFIDFSKGY